MNEDAEGSEASASGPSLDTVSCGGASNCMGNERGLRHQRECTPAGSSGVTAVATPTSIVVFGYARSDAMDLRWIWSCTASLLGAKLHTQEEVHGRISPGSDDFPGRRHRR